MLFSLFSCSHTSDSIYNIDKMGEGLTIPQILQNLRKKIIAMLKQNLWSLGLPRVLEKFCFAVVLKLSAISPPGFQRTTTPRVKTPMQQ